MSDDIVTQAYQEAIAYADMKRQGVNTVELHHSSFDTPARLVVSHGEILSAEPLIFGHKLRLEADAPQDGGELVTFQAAQIEVTMPGAEENQLPEMRFAIDGVSGTIARLLKRAAEQDDPEQILVIYRYYFLDDPDTVHRKIGGLYLTSPKADLYRVEGGASPIDVTKIAFTTRKYNAIENPSLSA